MRVLVIGCRLPADGYPNAANTVRLLMELPGVELVDLRSRLPESLHLWRALRSGGGAAARAAWHLASASIVGLWRLCRVHRAGDITYLPYPAVLTLWLLSWLPSRSRPVCIADAYISIWDSLFNDRADSGGSLTANLARWVEARALRAASLVLVDTEASRAFYIQQFGLPVERVRSLPLAIDAAPFIARRALTPSGTRIRVLFVGTMIPLHGVGTVLGAAHLLAYRDDIEFRLVGDGQIGAEVQAVMEAGLIPNLSWRREWISMDALAEEIANAHICLGVFGGEGKAGRVLPLKVYYALAAGRALITQAHLSTPMGVPAPPIAGVKAVGTVALSESILHYTENQQERNGLDAEAAVFYDEWLSDKAITARWNELLTAVAQNIGYKKTRPTDGLL